MSSKLKIPKSVRYDNSLPGELRLSYRWDKVLFLNHFMQGIGIGLGSLFLTLALAIVVGSTGFFDFDTPLLHLIYIIPIAILLYFWTRGIAYLFSKTTIYVDQDVITVSSREITGRKEQHIPIQLIQSVQINRPDNDHKQMLVLKTRSQERDIYLKGLTEKGKKLNFLYKCHKEEVEKRSK